MNQFFRVPGVFEMVYDSFKVKNCQLGDEEYRWKTPTVSRYLEDYIGVHFSVTRCSSFTDQVLEKLKNGRHPLIALKVRLIALAFQ